MHPTSFFLFLAAGAVALPGLPGQFEKKGKPNLQISCTSTGLEDGNTKETKWRASSEDCSGATDKLVDLFKDKPSPVALPPNSCSVVTKSGKCEVSVCFANNINKMVYPYELYAAARILHARHKHDKGVAGWVSIEDQYDQFQTFVKLAREDTGVPPGMEWKKWPSKRGGIGDGPRANRHDAPDGGAERNDTTTRSLEARADPPQIIITPPDDDKDHTINRERETIIRENAGLTDFTTEMRINWGNPQYQRRSGSADQDVQMQERLVEFYEDRTRDNGRPLALRPAPYLAPAEPGEEGGVYIGMELVAANNQNLRAFGSAADLKDVLNFARLQWLGSRSGSFIMRVWRGGSEIGHVFIRAWRERYPGDGAAPTCPAN